MDGWENQTSSGRRSLVGLQGGRLFHANSQKDEGDEDERPWYSITYAIACNNAGKKEAAGEWLGRAIKTMENQNEDISHAASFLIRETPPSEAEIDTIVLPPRAKAMLLAALAQKHPQASPGLFALARKFNIDRSFPYHLLNRITAAHQANVQ